MTVINEERNEKNIDPGGPRVDVSSVDIKADIDGNKVTISAYNNDPFYITYPDGVLSSMTVEDRRILLDNYIYCSTANLRLFFDSVVYDSSKPYLANFVERTLVTDIPRIMKGYMKTYDELKNQFDESEAVFVEDYQNKLQNVSEKELEEGAIIALSFGKDSLISYALLKELGLNYKLVSLDLGLAADFKVKKDLIARFEKEQNENVVLVHDETDNIFSDDYLNTGYDYMSYTNGLLAMALQMIPFATHYKHKYLVFGNERDLDGYFMSEDHKRVYHSYDQSASYMRKEIKAVKDFTNNSIQVLSVIKPIYDLAIYKILANRYPDLMKYLLSCELGDDTQWCGNCFTCAKTFLYMSPFMDPKSFGMMTDFFSLEKYRIYYPLFGNTSDLEYLTKQTSFTNLMDFAYMRTLPPSVRDQELLAFLLCYRKGMTGPLMDLFVKEHLSEAEKRESELRKRFFGIFNHTIIPDSIKGNLLNIFKEELEPLQ